MLPVLVLPLYPGKRIKEKNNKNQISIGTDGFLPLSAIL